MKKIFEKVKKVALQSIGLAVVILLWAPALILKDLSGFIFTKIDSLVSEIQKYIFK